MRYVVVFRDDSGHPYSHWLKPGFRHCFVCIERNGLWIEVNGYRGAPFTQYLTESDDYDLAGFYRDQGAKVIEGDRPERALMSPLALRNCVGLVKSFVGYRSWSVTPWQLYRHMSKNM